MKTSEILEKIALIPADIVEKYDIRAKPENCKVYVFHPNFIALSFRQITEICLEDTELYFGLKNGYVRLHMLRLETMVSFF